MAKSPVHSLQTDLANTGRETFSIKVLSQDRAVAVGLGANRLELGGA